MMAAWLAFSLVLPFDHFFFLLLPTLSDYQRKTSKYQARDHENRWELIQLYQASLKFTSEPLNTDRDRWMAEAIVEIMGIDGLTISDDPRLQGCLN